MTQLKTVLEIEGYKIELNFIKGCPATNNDLKLSELIKEATKLGLTVFSQRANLGGEDFSCFQEHIKGAMFNLGTGIGSSLHNGEFKVDPDALK
jgi:metal-dependent amidase/aminoacylase/carboxypeptidase family protein